MPWCGVIRLATNWVNLATAEAQTQGADLNIVLATIEAETGGRNVLGDGGNALGYGQVWPYWHKDAFQYAANRYRIEWPSTLAEQQQLTLSNDGFSMAVAVYVIKRIWNGQGKDFRKFTLAYVGPKIPDSDYQRRYKIWLKYQGDSGQTVVTGGGWDLTMTGQFDGVNIPASNYGIVANSQKFGNILYGRRYRVIVSNASGTALDVSQLRCTFKISKTILQQPNLSEVTIYNLSPDAENSLIQEGSRVIVEAGYEGDQYGLIFDGDIVQPIRDKEDGVTYRLTLRAMDGDRFMNYGFVGFSILKGQTSRSQIDNIISQVQMPINRGLISDSFSHATLPRGKVVFGLARDYLRQLAQSQDATFYVEDNKVNIIKATDLPPDEIFDLSPESGLIGVPAQNENGVSFKCLLNPRIKINSLVHIDNSLIRSQGYQAGQVIRNLDSEGIYRVISITYTGDTRGDDWQCECETVSQAGLMPSMMSTATANPW